MCLIIDGVQLGRFLCLHVSQNHVLYNRGCLGFDETCYLFCEYFPRLYDFSVSSLSHLFLVIYLFIFFWSVARTSLRKQNAECDMFVQSLSLPNVHISVFLLFGQNLLAHTQT